MGGFLLAVLLPAANLAALPASGPVVDILLPAGGVVQGKRFDLYFRLDDHSTEQPLVLMSNPGSGLKVVAGPEVIRAAGIPGLVPAAADDPGPDEEYVFIRYVFQASEAGYLHLPPVSIRLGSRNYLSRETLIPVSSARKPGWVPPRLEWLLPAGPVYEGQAVPVRLNLRYLDTLLLTPAPENPQVPGGILEPLKEAGNIEKETIAGREFHVMPVAAYMLTPSTRGKLVVPSVSLPVNGEKIMAPAVTLAVQALPGEPGLSGAVGNFVFDSRVEPREVELDGQFTVVLELSGLGNIHFLQLPKPDFSAFTVLGSEEQTDARPGDGGYQGTRSVRYRLAAANPGFQSIQIPAFSFFDPAAGTKVVPAKMLQVQVVAKKKASETPEQLSWRFPGPETLQSLPPTIHEGPWFWLLGGLVLALLGYGTAGRLWFPRLPTLPIAFAGSAALVVVLILAFLAGAFGQPLGQADRSQLSSMAGMMQEGDFEAAVAAGRELAARHPAQVDLLGTMADCAGRSGRPALALYCLSEALRAAPWRSDIRAVMTGLEQAAGLDRQLRIIEYPPRHLMFLGGLACLFVVAWLLLVLPSRNRGLLYSLVFVLILTGGGLLVLNAVAAGQAEAPRAVISEAGAALRKIPDQEATEWLVLAPGTTLARAGKAGEFILVETAFGIQGWVPASSLYAGPLAAAGK